MQAFVDARPATGDPGGVSMGYVEDGPGSKTKQTGMHATLQ